MSPHTDFVITFKNSDRVIKINAYWLIKGLGDMDYIKDKGILDDLKYIKANYKEFILSRAIDTPLAKQQYMYFDILIWVDSGDWIIEVDGPRSMWNEKISFRALREGDEMRITHGIKRIIEHEAKELNHPFCKMLIEGELIKHIT